MANIKKIDLEPMKLSEIVEHIGFSRIDNFQEMEIEHVSSDSRERLPNAMFVGVKGLTSDGASFAPKAIANGARVVVYETAVPAMQEGIVYVQSSDTRKVQSELAALVYGYAGHNLKTVGITGTNGKTSFVYILRHILNHCGSKCGLIGTTEYDLGKRVLTPSHTTPDAVFLQRYMREMVECGCSHLVMEVSSHALSLDRVRGIAYDISVFANLSRDHLDFHGNMEDYARCKSQLFSSCTKETGVSLINGDDDYAGFMVRSCRAQYKLYSRHKECRADLLAESFSYNERGLLITFLYNCNHYVVSTNLFGDFQVYNVSAAILSALELGLSMEQIAGALASDVLIPGRLESVETPRGHVFIDYAHTPDALEKAILSLQGIPGKKITTVFGCGGDRDRSKRGEMGQIALRHSHRVFVTSDNPRFEDPLAIIEDITRDLEPGCCYTVIENRAEAIGAALVHCSDDDIILIAGKGHETYQDIKGVKHPFSDKNIVTEYFGG